MSKPVDKLPSWNIRVKQIVDRLTDSDDRQELPAGPDGLGSVKTYRFRGRNDVEALDEFHMNVAIGCLEDFEITAEECKPTNEDQLVIWMRVGDEDGYHAFDTVEDAAQGLWDSDRVASVERFDSGVTAPGFEGENYISLYWGTDPQDGSAEMTRLLTDDELEEFNLSLESCADCEHVSRTD